MFGIGSRGDAQPMGVFGAELSARGHQVMLGLSSDLVWVGEAFGLGTVDMRISARESLASEDSRRRLAAGDYQAYVKWLVDYKNSIADQLQTDLIALASDADVIVSGRATEAEVAVIAEANGTPLICLHHAPIRSNSAFPHLLVSTEVMSAERNLETHVQVEKAGWKAIGPYVNALRARVGLPETDDSTPARLARAGTTEIQAYSRFVVPELADWEPRRPLTGFLGLTPGQRGLLGEDAVDPALDEWLDDGDPPVYFGFGGMPVLDGDAMLSVIENVSRTLGVRALVSAGWKDVEPGTTTGGRLLVAGALDHDAVLPRCQVAVHHGGAGTTATCLKAGLPTVVCPAFAYQPFWGAQLQRLGVGTTLPFTELSEQTLTSAIQPLLATGPRRRAAELGVRLAFENGAALAADALEKSLDL
jgi:UDP:flavonoid glycosyltransferase YjiC (YdhE family)